MSTVDVNFRIVQCEDPGDFIFTLAELLGEEVDFLDVAAAVARAICYPEGATVRMTTDHLGKLVQAKHRAFDEDNLVVIEVRSVIEVPDLDVDFTVFVIDADFEVVE